MDSLVSNYVSFNEFVELFLYGIVFSTILSLKEIRSFLASTDLRQAILTEAEPRLLNRIRIPRVSNRIWWLIVCLWLMSLWLSTMPTFSILGLLSSLTLYFFVFSRIWSLHFVLKKTSLIPCYLGLFLIYRCLELLPNLNLDESAWIASKAILASVYLGAGMHKIKVWWRRPGYLNALQGHLAVSALLRNTKVSGVLIQYPALCRWIFLLTIVWEITMPVICVLPGAVSLVYGVMGLAFHLGTLIVMRIDYLRFYWPVYMVFLADLKLVLGFY